MTDQNPTTRSREQGLENARGAQFLIPELPLHVLPTLAVAVGLNEALFLQQLHDGVRLSPHIHEGRRWISNGHEDWQGRFPFWSLMTIRRLIMRLEKPLPGCDRPMIATTIELNPHHMDQIKWYTLDYDALDGLCASIERAAKSTSTPIPGLSSDALSTSG